MKTVCSDTCNICGKQVDFIIDDNAALLRDAICQECHASLRVSDVVGVLRKEMSEYQSEHHCQPRILNLCSRGAVHELYHQMKGYVCGEYFDGVKSGERKGDILCIDLQNIPFEKDSFDIVITEDVLEHVNDIYQALGEINRVLRLGGLHIFTVPVHENIVTMSRKRKPEVYHGDPLRSEGALVITDFGRDLSDFVDRFGMKTALKNCHRFHAPEEISFIDDEYESYNQNKQHLMEVFRYNSTVAISRKIRQMEGKDLYMNQNNLQEANPADNFGYTKQSNNIMSDGDDSGTAIEFTGERFVPGVGDEYIIAEHMQRYRSIVDLLKGKTVLDAACGTGYGSALMASTASEVVGIDISPDAIAFARSRYGHIPNLRYQEASIEKLPFADHSLDVVVSFETIEHVPIPVQQAFLVEIKRCLKEDGILIMSSPDRRTYSDLRQFDNKYHIHEFYYDEYTAFLAQEFKYIRHYLQGEQIMKGELIRPAQEAAGKIKLLNEPDWNSDKDLYIISLCSNAQGQIDEKDISGFQPYVYMPTVITYVMIKGNYVAHDIIQPVAFAKGKNYCARFDLQNIRTEGQRLRFDPLENACCEIEILALRTDIKDYSIEAVNALHSKGSRYTFITTDPIIDISGSFASASYLEIEYSLRIINADEVSRLAEAKLQEQSDLLQNQLNAMTAERDFLRQQLELITSAKGYKMLEKLRQAKDKLSLS